MRSWQTFKQEKQKAWLWVLVFVNSPQSRSTWKDWPCWLVCGQKSDLSSLLWAAPGSQPIFKWETELRTRKQQTHKMPFSPLLAMAATALTSCSSRDTVDCVSELEANRIPFALKSHFVGNGNERKTPAGQMNTTCFSCLCSCKHCSIQATPIKDAGSGSALGKSAEWGAILKVEKTRRKAVLSVCTELIKITVRNYTVSVPCAERRRRIPRMSLEHLLKHGGTRILLKNLDKPMWGNY